METRDFGVQHQVRYRDSGNLHLCQLQEEPREGKTEQAVPWKERQLQEVAEKGL